MAMWLIIFCHTQNTNIDEPVMPLQPDSTDNSDGRKTYAASLGVAAHCRSLIAGAKNIR